MDRKYGQRGYMDDGGDREKQREKPKEKPKGGPRGSKGKRAIPAEGPPAARAAPARPLLLMPVVPLIIYSRNEEFSAADYANYANGLIRVIGVIRGFCCYSGEV